MLQHAEWFANTQSRVVVAKTNWRKTRLCPVRISEETGPLYRLRRPWYRLSNAPGRDAGSRTERVGDRVVGE